MKRATKDSDGLHFVRHLYSRGQEATGHSWVRLNAALRDAVKVAIRGGLEFALGDFRALYHEMKAGYWIGSNPDGLYREACEFGNLSACRSYEECHGFKPYELEGQRVFVGRDFTWQGELVFCTSVAKEHLIACSYHPEGFSSGSRKILHRFAITNAEIAMEDKARSRASSDAKMKKARADAERWASSDLFPPALLARPVSELIACLEDYRRERIEDVVKRRFKKADKSTILDLLAMGYRYRNDYALIHRAIADFRYTERTAVQS